MRKPKPARAGLLAVAVGAGAVLLLALAVSVSQPLWFVRDHGAATDDLPPGLREPVVQGTADPDPARTADDQLGSWFSAFASVLLGVIAVVLLALLVRGVRQRRVRRRERHRLADARTAYAKVSSESVAAPPELVAAAERLEALLAAGSPRNAIVSCWVALEDACAGAGIPRHPAETSVEFTTRVIETFAVSDQAIGELAALYREARFSAHDLDESHRTRAVGALRQVTGDLRTRARTAQAPR